MSEQNKAPEPLSGFEIRYHHAIPKFCKVLGLDIREVPECEGGGFMLRIDQAEAIRDLLAELESPAPVQSPCGTCGNPWNQCECGDAPEQERRERQRRCNHAWRGKTPKCKWGKCTWVPFDGRIIRAYVDRRKSQPKPSALEAFSQSQSDALEHRDGQVVVLKAENARLAPLQESFNQCCDENARLREALERILEISSDRERFVMQGPRAFAAAENVARAALKGDE